MKSGLVLAFAIATVVGCAVTRPHSAELAVDLADRGDPQPREINARVEMVGFVASLLVRWTARSHSLAARNLIADE